MSDTNTIMLDFEQISSVSYSDYIYDKSVQYLNLKNFPKNSNIKKENNILTLYSKAIDIEDMSVADVTEIILDTFPDSDLYVYEEHPEDYLNSSALFLTDFNSTLAVKYYVTELIVRLDLIETYTDKFNNSFELKELRVFDMYNQEIAYFKREDSIRIAARDQNFTLVCLYEAVDLKINYMQEFPMTSLKQLSSMVSVPGK